MPKQFLLSIPSDSAEVLVTMQGVFEARASATVRAKASCLGSKTNVPALAYISSSLSRAKS
jgi:hypothetical protein